jgi:ABC-type antimicrobial peptide transport system permease subunit
MLVSATGPLGEVFEGDWYLLRAVILGVWLLVCVLLALAASGIYAIMSFSVAERTTEIGIRSALGASRREVIISVARRAMAQIAVGVLLGLPFAAAFLVNGDGSRYVDAGRSLVVGIVVMTVVGLAACTGPTLRALRIHPREAMNGDG